MHIEKTYRFLDGGLCIIVVHRVPVRFHIYEFRGGVENCTHPIARDHHIIMAVLRPPKGETTYCGI
jgi:hypothetical protein